MAVTAYYVDTTSGNDADGGGSGDPWQTIQHALNTVTLPAVIYLTGTDAGVTNITWRVAGTTTPITIIGGTIDYASRTAGKAANDLANYTFWNCNQINIGGGNFWANMKGRFIECDILARTPGGAITGTNALSDFVNCTLNCSMSAPGNINGCTITSGAYVYCNVGKVYTRNKLLDGSYLSVPYLASEISHNSFSGDSASAFIRLWNNAQFNSLPIFNNVFESASARDVIGAGSGATSGWVLGRGNVIAGAANMYASGFTNVGTDDTTTIATAYEDANLTPSASLAAIVGSDGLTPGAIQVSGGGVAAVHPLGGA